MLNRSSNYHFIYRYQFKRTAKCVYILSIRLRFSGFVAIVINLSRVNIIIVSIKKARSSIHNSPSIQVLSVNLL